MIGDPAALEIAATSARPQSHGPPLAPREHLVCDPGRTSGRNFSEMTTTNGRLPEVPSQRSPLASGSVAEHVVRGAVGLLAAVLGIVLVTVVGPASLLLLGVTVIAWRGCPTCWAVGLFGTLADSRAGAAARAADRSSPAAENLASPVRRSPVADGTDPFVVHRCGLTSRSHAKRGGRAPAGAARPGRRVR